MKYARLALKFLIAAALLGTACSAAAAPNFLGELPVDGLAAVDPAAQPALR